MNLCINPHADRIRPKLGKQSADKLLSKLTLGLLRQARSLTMVPNEAFNLIETGRHTGEILPSRPGDFIVPQHEAALIHDEIIWLTVSWIDRQHMNWRTSAGTRQRGDLW